MARNCANRSCATVCRPNQGKLFRLDIDLGSLSGTDEQVTEYIWLCAACAQVMHPEVEITRDSVILRLTKNDAMSVAVPATAAPLRWAN